MRPLARAAEPWRRDPHRLAARAPPPRLHLGRLGRLPRLRIIRLLRRLLRRTRLACGCCGQHHHRAPAAVVASRLVVRSCRLVHWRHLLQSTTRHLVYRSVVHRRHLLQHAHTTTRTEGPSCRSSIGGGVRAVPAATTAAATTAGSAALARLAPARALARGPTQAEGARAAQRPPRAARQRSGRRDQRSQRWRCLVGRCCVGRRPRTRRRRTRRRRPHRHRRPYCPCCTSTCSSPS